ncbi:MAG: hypothetical protein INR73_00545 [Williamsia sp.]|nr:hypothetical protein [Williamsia sp.]
MTFTPYISVYFEGSFDHDWLGDNFQRAILLFSKNLEYNKRLYRTRVNILLGDKERIWTDGSIKYHWIRNPVDTSKQVSDTDKIDLGLRIIYESMIAIGTIEGWNLAAIKTAYEDSVADHSNLIWYSALKANKKRSLKARVKFPYEGNLKCSLTAQFFDQNKNWIYDVPILATFLDFFGGSHVFSKPGWLDNERFGFQLVNSQLLIFANIQTKEPEIVIHEKNWSREELEGQLRMLTYKQFSSKEEFVAWASL